MNLYRLVVDRAPSSNEPSEIETLTYYVLAKSEDAVRLWGKQQGLTVRASRVDLELVSQNTTMSKVGGTVDVVLEE